MGVQNPMMRDYLHLWEIRMTRWYPFSSLPNRFSANVDAATCTVDQGQDKRHDSTQNTPEKLVRERRHHVSYSGNAGGISTDS